MSTWDLIKAAMILGGGIALFLLGTEIAADGLQRTAGERVRAMLARLVANRWKAATGGLAASTLIHSGPATIVVLGYVNAGILGFGESIPIIFGANIGTTLSMQIVAFNIGQACFGVLLFGLLLRRFARGQTLRDIGLVVIGFGLLFLGLETMKMAIEPLRDTALMEGAVSLFNERSATGFLLALVASTILTAIFQSSGVVISLLFSFAALGVIGDFSAAIPFVLGAHIGTCTMTILAAIGGSAQAWRAAISHLAFNILGAVVATAMIPVYTWLMPLMTGDVTRQIANFNTFKQVFNALLFIPMAPLFEMAILRATRRWGAAEAERCHLDSTLLATPENAILAVIRELSRQSRIVNRMLRQALDGLVSLDLAKFKPVHVDEQSVDLIKRAIQVYIARISERSLSQRQALMLERLIITSNAIERIGDHVEDIGYLSRMKVKKDIWFPDDQMYRLLELSGLVCEMLETTMKALDPRQDDSHGLAAKVLQQRSRYKKGSRELQKLAQESIKGNGSAAIELFFLRYLTILDKIVSHLKAIARQESQDTYDVDDTELDQVEPLAPKPAGRPPEHPIHRTFAEALEDVGSRSQASVVPPRIQ